MKPKKGRNKMTFTVFIVIVILVIALFALVIMRSLKKTKVVYQVSSSSLVYDENYNHIEVTSPSTITKNWNNKYYLETDNEKYTLGEFSVAYNPGDYRMYTYGDNYQVYSNGETEKYTDEHEIIRTSEETFYKISDRKYLIVSSDITDTTNTFSAKNYLIVELDKIGNASFMNNETSIKTINEMVLNCGKFIFDIANEKLIFEDNEIDLKKIGGSTNEYVKKEVVIEPEEVEEVQEVKQLTENDLKKLESQIAEKIKENSTAINNRFDQSSTSTNNLITDITATVNTATEQIVSQKNYYKVAKLSSISSGVNYLDVNYYISDPINEYAQVYLKVVDNSGITNTYNVNKSDSTYRILDLTPDQEYTVSLCYTYSVLSSLGTVTKEETADVIKYKTHLPSYELTVTKVTKNKIYFNFKADKTFTIESGKIVLYIDGSEIGDADINMIEAVKTGGYTSYIEYQEPGNVVILKLENAIYNDDLIELNVQTKYLN